MIEHSQTLPYQKHSGTSKAGAEDARERAASQEAAVYEYLRDIHPIGATDEEIYLAAKKGNYPFKKSDHLVKESSWRRARVMLMKRGEVAFRRLRDAHTPGDLLACTARKYCPRCVITRKSSHGVRCVVWFTAHA